MTGFNTIRDELDRTIIYASEGDRYSALNTLNLLISDHLDKLLKPLSDASGLARAEHVGWGIFESGRLRIQKTRDLCHDAREVLRQRNEPLVITKLRQASDRWQT